MMRDKISRINTFVLDIDQEKKHKKCYDVFV